MYNKVIIAGNLGRDPELRYTPSGQAVTNLNVATNEVWTDQQGQRQKRTVWWRVAAWGRLAETCSQFLTRGSKVLVEGRINVDEETGGPRVFTRQDGTTGASLEITAQTVKFLSGRGDADMMDGGEVDFEGGPPPPTDEDQIPF